MYAGSLPAAFSHPSVKKKRPNAVRGITLSGRLRDSMRGITQSIDGGLSVHPRSRSLPWGTVVSSSRANQAPFVFSMK